MGTEHEHLPNYCYFTPDTPPRAMLDALPVGFTIRFDRKERARTQTPDMEARGGLWRAPIERLSDGSDGARLRGAVSDALAAFWGVVATAYPDVKLAPSAMSSFAEDAKSAVETLLSTTSEWTDDDTRALCKGLHPHHGWMPGRDLHTGCIRWCHRDSPVEIYATPDWESGGAEELVVQASDDSGKALYTAHLAWPVSERSRVSYMALLKPILAQFTPKRTLVATIDLTTVSDDDLIALVKQRLAVVGEHDGGALSVQVDLRVELPHGV